MSGNLLPTAGSASALLTSAAPSGSGVSLANEGVVTGASAETSVATAQEFMAALALAIKDAESTNLTSAPVSTEIAVDADDDANESLDEENGAAVAAPVQALLLGLGGVSGSAAAQSNGQARSAATVMRRSGEGAAAPMAQSLLDAATASGVAVGLTPDEAAAERQTAMASMPTMLSESLKQSEASKTSYLAPSVEAPSGERAAAALLESRISAPERAADLPAVQARVGAHAWTEQIAARVSMLHENGLHAASLRLTPEHLGPLEIQITVKNDQATVWFGASHAETRAALEQSLPRLRELLQAQGLTLSDAGVFREPPRDQQRSGRAGYESNAGDRTMGVEREVRIDVSRRLLDAYA